MKVTDEDVERALSCVPYFKSEPGYALALKQMRAALESLPQPDAKDAARYRWLRTHHENIWNGLPHIVSFHSGCNYVYGDKQADEAIDAAMAKQER